MSYLLGIKDEGGKAGIQKALSGNNPGSSGGDRNSVKKNLTTAIEIISKCFNVYAPNSTLRIGLFEL